MSNLVIGMIIVFIPIALSILETLKSRSAIDIDDFFLKGGNLTKNDLIHTTVSYGYQIAAVSLFAYWGFLYGFWTILVPIFWYLGFYLLKELNRTGLLDKFYQTNNGGTVHEFIGKYFNRKSIIVVAALISLLGLSGTAFFEAEFTSRIIARSLSTGNENLWFTILFLFFVGVTLSYLLKAGLRTLTLTNKIQLNFGFYTFNLFFLYIINKIISLGYLYTGISLYCISTILIIYLCWSYPNLNKVYANQENEPKNQTYSQTLLSIFITNIIGLIIIVFGNLDSRVIDSYHVFFQNQNFSNIFSLTGYKQNVSLVHFFPIISLLIANGLWQIVDISTWQRLSGLKNSNLSKLEISKSLDFIGKYSSVTWVLAILFGMSLKHIGFNFPDAYSALSDFTKISLSQGSFADQIFVTLFLMSMVMIMFSTLDSIISALSFTVYFDIIATKHKNLLGARLWTVLYTIFFLCLYYLLRLKISTIDSILYTFYSFQLVLFIPIILIIFNYKVSPRGVLVSMITGIIATIIPIFINSSLINPYSSAALFCVTTSFATILFFIKKRSNVR